MSTSEWEGGEEGGREEHKGLEEEGDVLEGSESGRIRGGLAGGGLEEERDLEGGSPEEGDLAGGGAP